MCGSRQTRYYLDITSRLTLAFEGRRAVCSSHVQRGHSRGDCLQDGVTARDGRGYEENFVDSGWCGGAVLWTSGRLQVCLDYA